MSDLCNTTVLMYKIKQLEAENTTLTSNLAAAKAERDALAAKVEVLSNQLKIAHDCLTCADETGYVEDCGFIDREAIAENISLSLSETPEQCLRDVQAEAVQDGLDAIGAPVTKFAKMSDDFVAGFNLCAALLQQHTAKVRQGGEK